MLEKPGAMLRMTATLWGGWDALRHPLPRTSRSALQYLDPVSRAFHGVCPFGLEIESTRQDYS